MPNHLIVITGPIAAGKSTIARGLAAALRQRGRSSAAVDLDLLYEMLGDDPKSDPHLWRRARATAGTLAAALFAQDVQVVVVEGEFWTAEQRALLTEGLPAHVIVRYVTLCVDFPAALRRAQADPTRGLSKIPEFLAAHLAEFQTILPALRRTDLILDTESTSAEQIVAQLVGEVT